MSIFTEYPNNVLAINDSEVAADWRLGLLRACGNEFVAGQLEVANYFGFAGLRSADSLHVSQPIVGGDNCEIVEVFGITEGSDKVYDYGNDDGIDKTVLSAKVTCACGKIENRNARVFLDPGYMLTGLAG